MADYLYLCVLTGFTSCRSKNTYACAGVGGEVGVGGDEGRGQEVRLFVQVEEGGGGMSH